MNSLNTMMLLPILGTLLIAVIPTEQTLRIKQAALGTTLLVAITGILTWLNFDSSNTDFQFAQSVEWIPSFGINYAVGVDGLSLVLILMSVLLTPIVVLAGWNESEAGRWSAKVFYILILVLETMMIGVFAATDVFLFYVIFELSLIHI